MNTRTVVSATNMSGFMRFSEQKDKKRQHSITERQIYFRRPTDDGAKHRTEKIEDIMKNVKRQLDTKT